MSCGVTTRTGTVEGGTSTSRSTLVARLFICALVIESIFQSCSVRPVARMTVAAPALEQSALLYIALEKGYFAKNGIDASIVDVDTGPAAIAAVKSGEAQIGETAEFPFVGAALAAADLRIIAADDRFENDYLVARKESGIAKIADLKGKRIGVTFGAITEFYLGRFLALNGIPPMGVKLVDLRPGDFVAAAIGGRTDAVVAWQPFVSRIAAARPGAFAVWPVQSSQFVYGILICEGAWLPDHGDAEVGFLRSLVQASDFVLRNRTAAEALVAKRLNYDISYLDSVWPEHQFRATLDYSLIAAMEDEARWSAGRSSTVPAKIPDFVAMVSSAGLAAVDKAGVTLMR